MITTELAEKASPRVSALPMNFFLVGASKKFIEYNNLESTISYATIKSVRKGGL